MYDDILNYFTNLMNSSKYPIQIIDNLRVMCHIVPNKQLRELCHLAENEDRNLCYIVDRRPINDKN